MAGKLTQVSVPPGFGKTTLLSSWIRQCGRPAPWLSLDDADNEVNRFLVYLTTALQQMGEVLPEWNRLEEAEAVLWEGVKLCQQ